MEKITSGLTTGLGTMFKGLIPDPKSPRTMKYPYTLGAQIAHFPWKFYWQHNWNFRYYLIAVVVAAPVFQWINGLANSPGNVAKWEAQKKKEALEEAAHHDDH